MSCDHQYVSIVIQGDRKTFIALEASVALLPLLAGDVFVAADDEDDNDDDELPKKSISSKLQCLLGAFRDVFFLFLLQSGVEKEQSLGDSTGGGGGGSEGGGVDAAIFNTSSRTRSVEYS